MPLHAFDDIDDAYAATRSFLFPIQRGTWLRLALIALFVGASTNIPTFGVNVPTTGTGEGIPIRALEEMVPPLTGTILLVLGVAIVAVILLVLAFMLVGAVMEFVFVETLRTESVGIRRDWGTYWRRGLRLFGFRVAVGFVTLLVLGSILAVVALPLLRGDATRAVGRLLVLSPVVVGLVLITGVINGFTTAFVVPVMLLEDRRVLAAWRRLWPTLRAEWHEYAVYAVISWLLAVVLNVLLAMILMFGALMLAIPFVLVGLLVLVLTELAGLVLIAVLATVHLVLLIFGALLLQVPIKTFLRYYALFVLGDTDAELDPIPDQRAAVRTGDGEPSAPDADDAGTSADEWVFHGDDDQE